GSSFTTRRRRSTRSRVTSACSRRRRPAPSTTRPPSLRRMRVKSLHAAWIASLPPALRQRLIAGLSPAAAETLHHDWRFWARPSQLPPGGEWRVWLLLAGRGFGKTRTGAELVRARVTAGARHVALVAPTASDAREVMVEGESGLLAIATDDEHPLYEPSRHRLTWRNGAVATLFS